MRVVCDTNVLVSGLLFGGNCRAVLALVSEGKIEGFTSSALNAELEEVLLRPKFRLTGQQVGAILDLVRQTFLLVLPCEQLNIVADDPDDDAVLEAAVAAEADRVVSGDEHLLRLRTFRSIRIVSPAELLQEIAAELG